MALKKIEFNSVTECRLVEELEKEIPEAAGMQVDLLEYDSYDDSYCVHLSFEVDTYVARHGKMWFRARISSTGQVEDLLWF